MTVISGSMAPQIKMGSTVMVKPMQDYKIGDVITFGPVSKTKSPTTHRIYDIKVTEGEPRYITKGDVNNAPDSREITKKDILGKVLFSVPYVGYAVDFAKKPIGFALIIIVPAALIIFDEIKKIWKEAVKIKNEKKLQSFNFISRDKMQLVKPKIKKIKIKVAKKMGENIKITVRTKRKNPAIIKIPEKTYFSVPLISKSLIKITVVFLIICLNWTGLSAIIETIAYFNDVESSPENSYSAGILDFSLEASSDFPPICSTDGQGAERTVSIINHGNPFKYAASSSDFSGDICNYVNLEANLDGGKPEYTGPLKDFNAGIFEFSEPENWVFKLTFLPDLPESLQGQTCTFKFVFDGSQTQNDLPFGEGFTDTEEITSNITAKVCCYTEIRFCGYWKNHQSVYAPHLPQTLGGYPTDIIVNTIYKANKILTDACGDCGCGCDNTMRGKLKGQLLAMKFNIAHFGIGEYFVESEGKTLNEIVAEADDLLRQHDPEPSPEVLEQMKDLLDYLNTLGQIPFCSETPPDECQLQLTKTASADEVEPGDEITYHLTFDNIGGKVCTGGGVRLKDTFNGSLLKYLDYTSTRTPKSFNKSTSYVEWNFGSIYPDDPLIEIDLEMKVKSGAQCDSTITNSAKYWSNETDWGEPVAVDSQVVCPPPPETGIVINEFLPNPAGNDKAPKPNGEWVELYNKGSEIVDVAGWVLYDENDANELPITSDNTNTGSTTIGSGEFLVVYRNGDNDFALDNTGGDTVRLYNGEIGGGADLIDSHTYTINAQEGKSFARIPNGSDNWVDPVPTPGEPNLVGDEATVFGPAVPEEGEEGYEEGMSVPEEGGEPEVPVVEEPVADSPDNSGGSTSEPTEQPSEEPSEMPVESPAETPGEPGDELPTDELPTIGQPVGEEPLIEEPVIEEPGDSTIEEPPVIDETPIIEEQPAVEEQPVIGPSDDFGNQSTPAENNSGSEGNSDGSSGSSGDTGSSGESVGSADGGSGETSAIDAPISE